MEEKKKRTKKGILIFLSIVAGILVLAVIASETGFMNSAKGGISGAESVHEKHIGVLFIEGTIAADDADYNHEYALDAVEGMMNNKKNQGLMLYINTPGGGVCESDELYLKIKEYQDQTSRPVYAYLWSQATSGGYYIAAPADKISANRNCWTGSIGVTLGNIFDVSELLEKYGIEVTTVTSGDNKAMGDITSPLTEEQREIFQSLVDEAHDQFVAIVADGRKLDESYVRKIADGRIYTAKQALDLKLIDGIVNTYDDAINEMKQEFGLNDCIVYEFRYESEFDILGSLINSVDKLTEMSSGSGDIKALTELIESNNEMPLQYMCEVTK